MVEQRHKNEFNTVLRMMAGDFNPNHDPATGRFTSGSGMEAMNKTGIKKRKKGIDSLKKRKKEHEDKIRHPEKIYDDWGSVSEEIKRRRINHWEKEIRGFDKEIGRYEREIADYERDIPR